MKKWTEYSAIIVIISLVAIFFYPSLLWRKQPVPTDSLVGLYHPFRDLYADSNPRGVVYKNYLITDPVRQQIPWKKISIDQWKKGTFPKWNPYNFSGSSLSANIQASLFYPFNLLFFIFDFPLAWTILIILQPLLSGILLYVYLCNRKVERIGSLIGSIIWSFGGFSIAWMTWGTILHVALWLPLTLLSLDKLFDQIVVSDKKVKSLRPNILFWLSVMIFSLCLQFFAGHIQISGYYLFVVSAYIFWKFICFKWPLSSVLFYLLAVLLSFVIITAVAWKPLIDLLAISARLGETSWQKSGWFLPWQHLIQFFVPDFFGNPSTLNYWGVWNYGEFIGYIGVIPLAIALYTLIFVKETSLKFWKLMLFLALIFILPTPVGKIFIYFKIPILSVLQPTRLMMVIDLSLAVIVAYGFKDFIDRKSGQFLTLKLLGLFYLFIWLFVIYFGFTSTGDMKINFLVAKRNLVFPSMILATGTLLIFLYTKFVNKKIKQVILILIIILIVFDLFRFGWKFIPFSDPKYFFPQTEAIKFLQNQKKPFRIASLDKRILPPNANAYYGLESVEGYDPLYSRDYELFFAVSERGKPDLASPYGFNRILNTQNLNTPLLRLLNLKYVLSLNDLDRPDLELVFREGETRIYEYLNFLPRFYFVNKTDSYESLQKAYNLLFDHNFNPEVTAITGQQIKLPELPFNSEEKIRLDLYSDNEINLSVLTKTERFLVIGNLFYNGWKAEIDDKPADLVKTNIILQGLLVPTGLHKVRLYYK